MKIPLTELGMDVEKKELKDCPFCGGEVEQHSDDMGGTWISHRVKHENGSQDPCILTKKNVDFYAAGDFTWNTRTAENEKNVLVIDEEKLKERIEYEIRMSTTNNGDFFGGVFMERIISVFQDAKQFLSIKESK